MNEITGSKNTEEDVFKILEKKYSKQYDPSQAIRRCNSGIKIFQNLPTHKE